MKKEMMILLTTLMASVVYAKDVNTVITGQGFVPLSQIEEAEVMVSQPYPSRAICGVALRISEGGRAQEILNKLEIRDVHGDNETPKVAQDRLIVEKKNKRPGAFTYLTVIKTLSGKSLKEEIASLDQYSQTEVLVETLFCH